MMNKLELLSQAYAEIRQATWSPQKWVYAVANGLNGKPYNYAVTHNWKAQKALWDCVHVPGPAPPPSAFANPALQEAYIQMAAAYWEPEKWVGAIQNGYHNAPYQYALSRNWKAQVQLWAARTAGPPPPPPPPPGPTVTPNPRLQNVAVGAFSPWDALAWPGCGICISADPSLDRFVDRAKADAARDAGHDISAWYVPDQVSHDRVVDVANRLGTDLILADCETLYRWQLAYHSGIRNGIYNLTALKDDPEAHAAIGSGEFHGMNEFYWNQSKSRQPNNYDLVADSMCIAVYNGCSDSQESDCWEPHVAQYEQAGYLWSTVCVYQQNMTATDWAAMPVRRTGDALAGLL